MTSGYKNTRLWQNSLAPRTGQDVHTDQREFLRNAYLEMRQNAALLVQLIPEDCRELTVHDVTHLDAIWEMADQISGNNFDLNPVEAFVFGASVLLHDAGMSIASYPGGVGQVRATPEWKTLAYETLKVDLEREPTDEEVWNPPTTSLARINFSVLRALHAKHAEELISTRWVSPGGVEMQLLENQSLVQSLGESIGRIAHSHHWDHTQISCDLRIALGAIPIPNFPSDWSVNEIKVACLLRCADAAHIDARRAPPFLLALRRPQGISAAHWSFQSKLNQPVKRDGALIYSSGKSFRLSDASAWWLCYDTIGMINEELQKCTSVLRDLQIPSFEVSRVYGADNPILLSKQITVEGWSPVKAQITVSDPIQLAITLGGKNLYGTNAISPIRELLQNAIDAVRARRKFEGRPSNWGTVQLILEETDGDVWLHVDDTGIGMSERVLVGPLLDFGKSLWGSATLQEEFPSSAGAKLQPIGKFGIGFFSIFLLGGQVRVISRRYTDAISDLRALEIASIKERPIVRAAKQREISAEFFTRVSVKLAAIESNQHLFDDDEVRYGIVHPRHKRTKLQAIQRAIADDIRFLTAAVDVNIRVHDATTHLEYSHYSNWLESSASDFLNDVLARLPDPTRKQQIALYSDLVVKLTDDQGNNYGRAALAAPGNGSRMQMGGVSVGGFLSSPTEGFEFVGVLNGDTADVSRRLSKIDVPPDVLRRWATDQAERYSKGNFSKAQLLRVSQAIVRIGGDPRSLPFCYAGGRIITKAELEQIISDVSELLFPVTTTVSDENFHLDNLSGLTSRYYNEVVPKHLVVVHLDAQYGEKLLPFDHRDEIRAGKDIEIDAPNMLQTHLSLIAPTIRAHWSEALNFSVIKRQLLPADQYKSEWLFKISRKKLGAD